MNPYSLEELEYIVKNLPNNKATGPSEISTEMIKLIKNNIIKKYILDLLNDFLTLNVLPDELNEASVILIPKKDEWIGDLGDLRPITLINTIKKIFSLLITKRLTTIIDQNDLLKGFNFGFRSNKSTKDPLMIMRLLIDDANNYNKSIYSAALDVQKAYDTVPFTSIINSLKRLKIPEKFIDQIMAS
jgi:hypothetical protein